MIKVRVDWHAQCPNCCTQLAIDYFDDSSDSATCPWCGQICYIDKGPDHIEVKEYINKAIRRIENRANEESTV
ncbi:MAG: hypothetical protein GX141_12345 [Armatimonadetes bacterium]|nr:hypothetical protein [Armatimonadota bacterium]